VHSLCFLPQRLHARLRKARERDTKLKGAFVAAKNRDPDRLVRFLTDTLGASRSAPHGKDRSARRRASPTPRAELQRLPRPGMGHSQAHLWPALLRMRGADQRDASGKITFDSEAYRAGLQWNAAGQ